MIIPFILGLAGCNEFDEQPEGELSADAAGEVKIYSEERRCNDDGEDCYMHYSSELTLESPENTISFDIDHNGSDYVIPGGSFMEFQDRYAEIPGTFTLEFPEDIGVKAEASAELYGGYDLVSDPFTATLHGYGCHIDIQLQMDTFPKDLGENEYLCDGHHLIEDGEGFTMTAVYSDIKGNPDFKKCLPLQAFLPSSETYACLTLEFDSPSISSDLYGDTE